MSAGEALPPVGSAPVDEASLVELGKDDLAALDELVESAIGAGSEAELPVLGYGEISLVLGWPLQQPRFACKRLPLFPSGGRFESYRDTLERYLRELSANGVVRRCRPSCAASTMTAVRSLATWCSP